MNASAPSASVTHDVAVIGAGPAGLAAATALARSLRSVVVIDAGEARNRFAGHAHNVLGNEGSSPLELLRRGRAEAVGYGAELRSGRVTRVDRAKDSFAICVDGAQGDLRVRRVVLATGLVDELPELPGLAERWGRTVLHCPYCHGYEVRGRRIAVLATGPTATHQALLFRQLSDEVTVVVQPGGEPDAESRSLLEARGVRLVEAVAASVEGEASLRFVGGESIEVDALVIAPRLAVRGELYEQLGGELSVHPMTGLPFIDVDASGRTAVDGVWAAGNARDLTGQIVASAAQGVMAGAAVNGDLVMEEAHRAASLV